MIEVGPWILSSSIITINSNPEWNERMAEALRHRPITINPNLVLFLTCLCLFTFEEKIKKTIKLAALV